MSDYTTNLEHKLDSLEYQVEQYENAIKNAIEQCNGWDGYGEAEWAMYNIKKDLKKALNEFKTV